MFVIIVKSPHRRNLVDNSLQLHHFRVILLSFEIYNSICSTASMVDSATV